MGRAEPGGQRASERTLEIHEVNPLETAKNSSLAKAMETALVYRFRTLEGIKVIEILGLITGVSK